jgi:hypothetical protein
MIYSERYGTFQNTIPKVDAEKKILHLTIDGQDFAYPFVHQQNRSNTQTFYSANGMFVYFGDGWTPVQLVRGTIPMNTKSYSHVSVRDGWLFVHNENKVITVGYVMSIKERGSIFTFTCHNGDKEETVEFSITAH